MINPRPLLAALLAGALSLWVFPAAAGASSGSQQVLTSHFSYQANSKGSRSVQQWLLQHPSYQNGAMVGEPREIGAVDVVYKAGLTPQAQTPGGLGGNGPSVSLPMSGHQGDTISIHGCTAGTVSQSWTHEWQGDPSTGGWVLVAYAFNAKSCGSGA